MMKSAIATAAIMLLGVYPAQAAYSITGGISGALSYYSGQRDFFRNTAALDMENARGRFDFTTTRQQAGTYTPGDATFDILYFGTANYDLSLLDAAGAGLLSLQGSGASACLRLTNYVKDATFSAEYVMDLNGNGSIGGNYLPSAFKMSTAGTASQSSFGFTFTNNALGRSGAISGTVPTSSLAFSPALAYTPPPVPTPAPAAALLMGPGLALLGLLRRRQGP